MTSKLTNTSNNKNKKQTSNSNSTTPTSEETRAPPAASTKCSRAMVSQSPTLVISNLGSISWCRVQWIRFRVHIIKRRLTVGLDLFRCIRIIWLASSSCIKIKTEARAYQVNIDYRVERNRQVGRIWYQVNINNLLRVRIKRK